MSANAVEALRKMIRGEPLSSGEKEELRRRHHPVPPAAIAATIVHQAIENLFGGSKP